VTPEEEATLITLGQQRYTIEAITQRLGVKDGTAHSRAYSLQRQGKTTIRP
jgi:hypothetical protein